MALMAILRGLLFHWSAMTWLLGMEMKGLCHITDEALLARLGLRRHSLALREGFQKCAFRNSIWRIVLSKIVIFIRQIASCLHRQLAKCKFLIANGE
jgi:hypothetical protein